MNGGSVLTHPTRYHLQEKAREQYVAHVTMGKTSAAAAHSMPTPPPTSASFLSQPQHAHSSSHLGGTGLGADPPASPLSMQSSMSESNVSIDEDLLEDLSGICNLDSVDPSNDTFLQDLEQNLEQHISHTVKSESGGSPSPSSSSNEFGLEAYGSSKNRPCMTSDEKNRRHKQVERKRRNKEDNAIEKFRSMLAPAPANDEERVTGRKMSRGDILQLAVGKMTQLQSEADSYKQKFQECYDLCENMVTFMQDWEGAVQSMGMTMPPDRTCNKFLHTFLKITKDKNSASSGSSNTRGLKSNRTSSTAATSPVAIPQKKKRVVAVVKTSKNKTVHSSKKNSVKSVDSGIHSPIVGGSMDLSDMEDTLENSLLNGDPLLSTSSSFIPSQLSNSNPPPSLTSPVKGEIDFSDVIVADESVHMQTEHYLPTHPVSLRSKKRKCARNFVLEHGCAIPDNELEQYGFTPTLVLRQAKGKTEMHAIEIDHSLLYDSSLGELGSSFQT